MRSRFMAVGTCGIALLGVLVAATQSGADAKKPTSTPITVEMLREQPVIGDLGVPLGTVTEIRGTIVAGRTLHMKLYSDEYLIQVTEAGGRRLETPRILSFSAWGDQPEVRAVLPDSERALRKPHEKPGTPADLLKLESQYVGKTFRLQAYEYGGFRGIPSDMPEGAIRFAGVGFGFQTELVIIAVLENK